MSIDDETLVGANKYGRGIGVVKTVDFVPFEAFHRFNGVIFVHVQTFGGAQINTVVIPLAKGGYVWVKEVLKLVVIFERISAEDAQTFVGANEHKAFIVGDDGVNVVIDETVFTVVIHELFSVKTTQSTVAPTPQISLGILIHARYLYKGQATFYTVVFKKKLLSPELREMEAEKNKRYVSGCFNNLSLYASQKYRLSLSLFTLLFLSYSFRLWRPSVANHLLYRRRKNSL